MTLLITIFAAVITTVVWYNHTPDNKMCLSVPVFLYWGASIMWLIDAVFEYSELHADYFAPAVEDMINDAFLGLSVVALGLIVWVIVLLIKDPKGRVKAALQKKNA